SPGFEFPNKLTCASIKRIITTVHTTKIDPLIKYNRRRIYSASSFKFPPYFSSFEIKSIKEMVLASNIYFVLKYYWRRVAFRFAVKLPFRIVNSYTIHFSCRGRSHDQQIVQE